MMSMAKPNKFLTISKHFVSCTKIVWKILQTTKCLQLSALHMLLTTNAKDEPFAAELSTIGRRSSRAEIRPKNMLLQ